MRVVAIFAAVLLVVVILTAILSTVATSTTKGTRQVLCIGILHNAENTAHSDPRVISLCEEVGVHPLSSSPG